MKRSIASRDLARTDFADVLDGRRLPAIHPGEVLLEEFIKPLAITRYRAAKALGLTYTEFVA